jgi:hypothetical protein
VLALAASEIAQLGDFVAQLGVALVLALDLIFKLADVPLVAHWNHL